MDYEVLFIDQQLLDLYESVERVHSFQILHYHAEEQMEYLAVK